MLPANWYWPVLGLGLLLLGMAWGWGGLSAPGDPGPGPEAGLGATRDQVAQDLRAQQREPGG